LGPSASKNFQRVHFSPKPPNIRPGKEIASLNKTMKNLSNVHAIFAQISCFVETCERNSKYSTKSPKIGSGGQFCRKIAPEGDFKPKHTVE
jgi:hypothetical protein